MILRKFVFDACMCMFLFYICVWADFVGLMSIVLNMRTV